MQEFHKIQTMYLRDPATNHKTLLEGQWAEPEFGYLANNKWLFTEKIDGTNIRVMWSADKCEFGGRTDDAMIQVNLLERLQEMFIADVLRTVFNDG